MTPKFNIGDKIWTPSYEGRDNQVPCPVCFGKKEVRVILGDDEIVGVPCNFCGNGYGGSRGYVIEKEYLWKVKEKIIEKIEFSSNEVIYYTICNHVLREIEVFDNKEDAGKRGLEKSEILSRDNKEKDSNRKEYSNKSYGWHVGYYRREEKRAREEAERYAKKVVSMEKLAEKYKKQ